MKFVEPSIMQSLMENVAGEDLIFDICETYIFDALAMLIEPQCKRMA